MLQRWFGSTSHPDAENPYFLYAASNLGSMVALLGYPLLLEPQLRLAQQSWLWTGGYGVLVVLTVGVRLAAVAGAQWGATPARSLRVGHRHHQQREASSVGAARAAALQPAAGRHPVSFAGHRGDPPALGDSGAVPADVHHRLRPQARPAARCDGTAAAGGRTPAGDSDVLESEHVHHGALSAAPAGVLVTHHGVPRRAVAGPAPAADLTEFYLWISVGGVLGGVFNVLVAPGDLDRIIEYPWRSRRLHAAPRSPWGRRHALAGAGPVASTGVRVGSALARSGGEQRPVDIRRGTTAVLSAVVASSNFSSRPTRSASGWQSEREPRWRPDQAEPGRGADSGANLFGTHKAVRDPARMHHRFVHGSTLHGAQARDPAERRNPLTYYQREGPLGRIFEGSSAHRGKA